MFVQQWNHYGSGFAWLAKGRAYYGSKMSVSQGVSFLLRRNPTLHAFHSFLSSTVQLQVGPIYQIKWSHHLIIGWSRGLLCPQGFHSVALIVHLLSLLTMCPTHVCLLFRMFLIRSVTLLFPNAVCTFSKLVVPKRPDLTAICHDWENTFVERFPFQFHWHIFLLHDVVQFAECTPSLSESPFHFLYLVMVLISLA